MFGDLTLSEANGNTSIDYVSGSIILEGVASATLDEQDFVFV
ncbi:hypothetical protein [uncultured Roseobacter sp.]|nr:hypothetical protein [uncultured Roseobacter sp.]